MSARQSIPDHLDSRMGRHLRLAPSCFQMCLSRSLASQPILFPFLSSQRTVGRGWGGVFLSCQIDIKVRILPPKNGEIALCSNTRLIKCTHYVSQKQNGFNLTGIENRSLLRRSFRRRSFHRIFLSVKMLAKFLRL